MKRQEPAQLARFSHSVQIQAVRTRTRHCRQVSPNNWIKKKWFNQSCWHDRCDCVVWTLLLYVSWFWHQKWDKSAVCLLVRLRFSSVGQLWAFAQCGPRHLKQINDSLQDFCSQRPGFTMKAPLFYFIHEEEKKLENEVSRLHCKSKRCPEMRQTDFARVVLRNERWTYFMHLDEGHLLLQHSLKSSASWIKDVRQNLLRRRSISSRTQLWMMFGDLISEGEHLLLIRDPWTIILPPLVKAVACIFTHFHIYDPSTHGSARSARWIWDSPPPLLLCSFFLY